MQPIRRADCPNCGGPIEFKLGSSIACVCPYCRFSVVRTDRELSALGRVADLVPTAPIMTVGDHGKLGSRGFVVGGRLQLDHGRGPWDEWYVEFEDGHWGWLAQAQGHFYLTFPVEGAQVPAFEDLAPEDTVTLSALGTSPLTVVERGGSRLVSAEGELPFPAVPGAQGRHADLEGPGGAFATIDYGDGSEPAKLFAGERIDRATLTLERQAPGPRPEQVVDAGRLRCPTCGAPVPIRVPQSAERAACGHCNSLLDFTDGKLAYLKHLDQPEVKPRIPLGSEGVLDGEEAVVIGFMQRFTVVDGVRYTWSEYLLHTRNGYRWLVEDQGHFTYVRPVSAAKVQRGGAPARVQKRPVRAFNSGTAAGGPVGGVVYFRVEMGDRATTEDFVAPPRLLSCERTASEVNWSYGKYISGRKLWKALGLKGKPPRPSGVAPCQPNPVPLLFSAMVAFVLLTALAIGAFAISRGKREVEVVEHHLRVPARATRPGVVPQQPQASITQSDPFTVRHGPTTIEVDLVTTVSNSWLGVSSALVNEETGDVREFYILAEEWHGVTGGERWREGDPTTTEYLSAVPSGRYSMRFQPEWGSTRPQAAPQAVVRVSPGRRSSFCCAAAGILLLFPLGWAVFRRARFEAQRWQHSNFAALFKEKNW